MISRTTNLTNIFLTLSNFSAFVVDNFANHFKLTFTDSVKDDIKHFVVEPVWYKYRFSNIMFESTPLGIEDFKYNMLNTFNDTFATCLSSTLHNIDYYKELYGTNKGTAFEKQIISSIMPINQSVDQELSKVNIAKGTTGQQLSEIVQINSAWNKALENYFTPSNLLDHVNRFKWLFYNLINQYYDTVEEGKYFFIKNTIESEDRANLTIELSMDGAPFIDITNFTDDMFLFAKEIVFRIAPVDLGLTVFSISNNGGLDNYYVSPMAPETEEVVYDLTESSYESITFTIGGYY